MSSTQLGSINDELSDLRGELPSELARQLPTLDTSETWKATELRSFLLYVGPIVMKSYLNPSYYQSFLSLSIGISIFCQENEESRISLLEYARQLLTYFVDNCATLYSPQFVSYNVHSILHISDDVESLQSSLNRISAFPFESYLNFLKGLVHGSNRPTQQAVNRLLELKNIGHQRPTTLSKTKVSNNFKDGCFFVNDNEVLFVTQISSDSVTGRLVNFTKFENVFGRHFPSKSFKIGFVRRELIDTASKVRLCPFQYICKAVCLSHKRGFAVVPLHHFDESTEAKNIFCSS